MLISTEIRSKKSLNHIRKVKDWYLDIISHVYDTFRALLYYCQNIRLNIISDWDNPDQDEFVPLPDLNDGLDDDYYYGGDPNLWMGSGELSDEYLMKDDRPLYQNQLDDPKVSAEWFNFIWGWNED